MRSFTILMTILLFACANKGETGQQGEKGEQGYVGPKGDKGDPGPQGIQGPKGDQGLQGSAGPKGDQGEIGLTGAQGIKGDKGDPGSIGLPGSDGTSCSGQSVEEGVLVICENQKFLVKHGDVGPIGPQGIQGVTGPKGETGSQGPQGEKGLKGDIGFEGMPGTKGDKGDPGQQGIQGPKGDQGIQGIQGIAGQKGEKGDKGDVGPQGPTGKDYVTECPPNSAPVILEGVLVYCYTIQPNQFTWLNCLKTCAIKKMQIASIEGLMFGCMSNPEIFINTEKNKKYWITTQLNPGSKDTYQEYQNQSFLTLLSSDTSCESSKHGSFCEWVIGTKSNCSLYPYSNKIFSFFTSWSPISGYPPPTGCICGKIP